MKQLQRLSHTVWECKYHIVWIPKYRKKVLYGKIREELVGVFHELANRRGCKILEGHLCVDHVHMLLSIPPKYGVAEVVGYLKGKSAIEIAKHFEKVRKITGASFWARGYFVSTVGMGEREIRLYIRNQEKEDRRVRSGRHCLPCAAAAETVRCCGRSIILRKTHARWRSGMRFMQSGFRCLRGW